MNSPLFAVSTIFAIITMFDASGVRRQAGEQAAVSESISNRFQSPC